eukprot:Lithocolla_globosa_v1_NODE_336_length_4409_cov_89.919844.p1 type:complete len:1363 gc:universal NODE_336_length_4409_cov_89.919844:300-4388(+)
MGQTFSLLVFRVGLVLSRRFQKENENKADLVVAHKAFQSFWCFFCRLCADEGYVVEAIVNIFPHPPPLVVVEPGTKMTMDEYEEHNTQDISQLDTTGSFRRNYDGSGNNPQRPWLGQGGRPYGNITGYKRTNIEFPPAREIIVAINKRVRFSPAPNYTNSLPPWIAFVAIHDFFRSDTGRGEDGDGIEHPTWNVHSSYLDQQVLYGFNEKTAKMIRTFKDGKLKPDAIADQRLTRLRQPLAILALFNRNHNYICEQLKARYGYRFRTDEELYHQARLINNICYISIILRDYAGSILGHIPKKGTSVPDPRGKFFTPKGMHLTMEFLFLYHFHPTVPESVPSLVKLQQRAEVGDSSNPLNLDATLLEIVSSPSGRFGPNNCPDFLIPHDIAALERSRGAGLGGWNDFLESIGRKRLKKFSQFSSDLEIRDILSKSYAHPDDVELLVGLTCHDPSHRGWGAPEILGESILSDAFGSIVNDRFYTTDYTPENYTEWGFQYGDEMSLAQLINQFTGVSLPPTIDTGKIVGLRDVGKADKYNRFPLGIKNELVKYYAQYHYYLNERQRVAGQSVFRIHLGMSGVMVRDHQAGKYYIQAPLDVLEREATVRKRFHFTKVSDYISGPDPRCPITLYASGRDHEVSRGFIEAVLAYRRPFMWDGCQEALSELFSEWEGRSSLDWRECVQQAGNRCCWKYLFDLTPTNEMLDRFHKGLAYVETDSSVLNWYSRKQFEDDYQTREDTKYVKTSRFYPFYLELAKEFGIKPSHVPIVLAFVATGNPLAIFSVYPLITFLHLRYDWYGKDLMKELQKSPHTSNFIMNNQLLDGFFWESLRLWPVPQYLNKIAKRDFPLPSSEGYFKIQKGDVLLCDLQSCFRDPKVFENADKFDPTRFLRKPELKEEIWPFGWLPNQANPYGCAARSSQDSDMLWKVVVSRLVATLTFEYIDKERVAVGPDFQDDFRTIFGEKSVEPLFKCRIMNVRPNPMAPSVVLEKIPEMDGIRTRKKFLSRMKDAVVKKKKNCCPFLSSAPQNGSNSDEEDNEEEDEEEELRNTGKRSFLALSNLSLNGGQNHTFGRRDHPDLVPLVFGYGGLPLEYQANSFAGYQAVVEQKLDGVCIQVQVTLDQEVVCFGEEQLFEKTGKTGKIAELTWHQLRHLQVTTTNPYNPSCPYPTRETIPLLSDVLKILSGKMLVVVEVVNFHANSPGDNKGRVVAKVILDSKMTQTCLLLSNDIVILESAKSFSSHTFHCGVHAIKNQNRGFLAEASAKWFQEGETGIIFNDPFEQHISDSSFADWLIRSQTVAGKLKTSAVSIDSTFLSATRLRQFASQGYIVGVTCSPTSSIPEQDNFLDFLSKNRRGWGTTKAEWWPR